MEWNLSADVVVIGAGAAGLAAAVSARDHGAAVIVVEENFDIGGHAMLSGGRVQLGGGNALQKKFNIKDSPDQVFADWTTHARGDAATTTAIWCAPSPTNACRPSSSCSTTA